MSTPILMTSRVLPLLEAAVAWDRARLEAARQRANGADGALAPVTEGIGRLHAKLLRTARAAVAGMEETVQIVAENARLQKEITAIMDHATSVASAVEEMAASATEVAQHAEEAVARAQETHHKAEEGNVAISSLMGDMDLLEQAVRDMAESVRRFMGFAGEINKLTATVREIANQTNLLALNAAIEAARAGEAGRGFAVVADEVKKLADKTAEATTEIEQVTATMNQLSEQVGGSLNQSLERLTQSVDALETVATVLGENTAAVHDVNQRVAQIAHAAAEQRSVAQEMAERLNAITASLQNEAREIESITTHARELADRFRGQFEVLAEGAPDRLLLEVVKADHMLWKIRLALLLHGHAEIGEDELKDHTQCRLGRWYYGTGAARYGAEQAYREMEAPHRRVHELAREIWGLVRDGRTDEAAERLRQMEGYSAELIGLLDQLGERLDGEARGQGDGRP